MTNAEHGTYLFAVSRGLPAGSLDGHEGFRREPLRLVEQEGLQAVVCAVDLAEFGEAALAEHLEDLAWVEDVARRHNDVVWLVAQHATTAPSRLVTIFAGDESVRRMLADRAEPLRSSLDAVEGCQEWSLKLYAAAAPVPPAGQRPTPVGTAAGSGAEYLRRKKEAAQQRRASSEQSAALAESAYSALADVAVAARRLAPQDPRLTGRRDPMVLNAAFLVPVERGPEFHAAVQGIDDGGGVLSAETGGPWPAYSFATLEQR